MRLLISGATKSMDRFAADPAVAPHIGHLWTPATGNRLTRVCETGLPWAADNAAFGDQWDTEAFEKAAFLKIMAAPTPPLFLTVPDVVGDARRTLDLFHIWHDILRHTTLPLALVLQDGSEDQLLPWDQFGWVFVGGTRRYLGGTWGKGPYVEWKESDAAAGLIREAGRRGKRVHAGRVNGLKRLRHFFNLGVDTCDGSSLSMFPDRWVPKFVDALREWRHTAGSTLIPAAVFDTMSDAHHLLAAAWESGDTTPLLVLADLFDEQADPDAAELLRLIAAEARTARHDPARDRRLRRLRFELSGRARLTAWPVMATDGDGGEASFSRRPDLARPDREYLLVRPDRRTVHHLRVELDGRDEVARCRRGRELLRHRLDRRNLEIIRRRGEVYPGSAFGLVNRFFPVPPGPADHAAAFADWSRRFEAAVQPALIPVPDLPAELVPFVAWVLAEYLACRPRRARAGEPVPGPHLFLYRNGRWHHAASLDLRDSGQASGLLRRRLRRERDRGVSAGLLVRVADGGRLSARKLVWFAGEGERETPNLAGAAATLGADDFLSAAADLGEGPAAFVLGTEADLRDLFSAGTSDFLTRPPRPL